MDKGRARPSAAPWQRGRLIWGALLSVVLGSLAAVVSAGGTAVRLGLIIAMLGAILTVVIDAFFRREESVHDGATRLAQISATLEVERSLGTASAQCRDFVTGLAALWEQVDRTGSVILRRIRDDRERDFLEDMHDLADGHSPLERRREFLPEFLHDLVEMVALSGTARDYWWSGRRRVDLATERAAIGKGLKLRRVLVLGRDEIDGAGDLVREQLEAGIDLRVIIREEVGPRHQHHLRADRALVTDTAGVIGVLRRGRESEDAATDAGHFTVNKGEIQDTMKILAALEAYEIPAERLSSLE